MTGKSIRIFSFCIVGVFVLTTLVFVCRIGKAASSGRIAAQQLFNTETGNLQRLFDEGSSLQDIYESLQYMALRNSSIAAITVTPVSDGRYVYPFVYPEHTRFVSFDHTGAPVLQITSPAVRIFSSSLTSFQGTPVPVTAAIYILTPTLIYNEGRIAFLIILCCTLSVFGVLFASGKNSGTETAKTAPAADTAINPQNDTGENTDSENDGYEYPQDAVSATADDIPAAKHIAETGTTGTEQKPQDIQEEADSTEQTDIPAGLFSKVTGFGWESYLLPRLNAELERAASTEQDLTILLICFKNFEKDAPYMEDISSVLLDSFNFRDLIFEYGTDSFAGILQNTDIEMTMSIAEKIYTESCTALQEYPGIQLAIGISARKSRLVTGERLLKEADQAAEKAFGAGGMPIVAFSANPEKYKDYIQENYS